MKYRVLLPLSLLICLVAVMANAQAYRLTEAEYRLQQGIQKYRGYHYEEAAQLYRLAAQYSPDHQACEIKARLADLHARPPAA